MCELTPDQKEEQRIRRCTEARDRTNALVDNVLAPETDVPWRTRRVLEDEVYAAELEHDCKKGLWRNKWR